MSITPQDPIRLRDVIYKPKSPNSSNDDMVWAYGELRRLSAVTQLLHENIQELLERVEALESP